ncbi:HD-GYP domain-containing protein [Paucisalibacillus sp. EB02]|uniref:HD-GYP domain-containing protein n=1 Tax=Paucisalibacillus sp. EB02 TaxID=1347087 RepID=UPI0004B558E4|nr:HD-GYP domain-containing protein [Paucisalibacillus sp. EB02]
MRVSSSQVVPGCVLLRDVKGKTNRPIIPQKTVLTAEHIKVLHKFLIEHVEVSERLKNGTPFQPQPASEKEKADHPNHSKEKIVDVTELSFRDHYDQVVEQYKKLFDSWRNNLPINNLAVRNLILPLIDRMDDIGSAVYTLHRFANKKDYFYHHGVSVSILSAYLGKKLGYQKGEWLQIGMAGLLSDAGMARLGDFVFHKEGLLTDEERLEIIKHPTYTYRMVEHISSIPSTVKLAVLQHHERMDGSGYPLGLSQEKIHSYARIIAVCDIYHAMTSERIYRKKQSPFSVIEELQKEQYSKLDIRIVQVFVDSIANFSIGTKVLLSNNQDGEIVFIDPKVPTRPILRLKNGEIITLSNHQDLHISEIL